MWHERTLVTYFSYSKTFFLYQASIKAKGNEVEMNFIDGDCPKNLAYLDVSDFFENPSGKIDHLIGDGNVCCD